MKNKLFILFLLICTLSIRAQENNDWRFINNSISIIPNKNYVDQAYVVKAKNKDWVCVLTTGPGAESKDGQHVVATISSDEGKNWSPMIDIEPSGIIPSSWATPYTTSYGRIYVFYVFDGDNVHTFPDGRPLRVRTLQGWYCFKYSDDHGKSWSKRYRLPMRKTTVDFINPWNGDLQLFWGISKPITVANSMYFSFTKLAIHAQEMGEGWFYKSNNINSERNPDKLNWELLPDGNEGLFEASMGITQEEHNIVSLKNNDLYCIFRTAEGFPAESYSRDGGHTWSVPEFARDKDGRVIKNPRACPRLFQCENGNYLLWYHNNNRDGYSGWRNPAWILGGIEKGGKIEWGQPEILLYGEGGDGFIPFGQKVLPKGNDRMSYPDLIEKEGKFWVTETKKDVITTEEIPDDYCQARLHHIDANLIEGLWRQGYDKKVTQSGLIWEDKSIKLSKDIPFSNFPSLKDGAFTVELLLNFEKLIPGQIILDNRNERGNGLSIGVTDKRTISIILNDNDILGEWDTDPGIVKPGQQHIVFVVDGKANLITTIVNGKLCDGGRYRSQGWNWFDKGIEEINGTGHLKILPDFVGEISAIRIYNRYLTTSEAISNYYGSIKKL